MHWVLIQPTKQNEPYVSEFHFRNQHVLARVSANELGPPLPSHSPPGANRRMQKHANVYGTTTFHFSEIIFCRLGLR